MSPIRKLPPSVVSMIAAGEVVERPLNIAKELIENAIDASSNKITIIIEDGGLQSIQVIDDGFGIPEEELETAFELHTTSKLDNDDPLNVDTLGFRGEALASIAAVSHIECISRTSTQSRGRKILVDGGNLSSSSHVSSELGTSIKITGLFHNTPARRKFLKSPNTERKRIVDLVNAYAIAYPHLHLRLQERTKNGQLKTRIETPQRTSILAVVFDCFGPDIANGLLPFDATIGSWVITGFLSKPQLTRSDRSLQFISVNGRPVAHNKLQATIEKSYGSQLMRQTHPIIILQLNGPIQDVDYNIHPQKSQIRFKTSDPLLDEIPTRVENALGVSSELPQLAQASLDRVRPPSIDLISTSQRATSTSINIGQGQPTEDLNSTASTPTYQTTLFEEKISPHDADIRVLGHIMLKFGLVEMQGELWMIDIHAADERIKFEMYSRGLERTPSRQHFLLPITVSLPNSEVEFLLEHKDDLERFGIQMSEKTSTEINIHSMPVYYDQEAKEESLRKMILDILSFLQDSDTSIPVDTPMNRIEYSIVSRLSCHGAIRSGYSIPNSEIKRVVSELMKCEYPWTCAHGRPTVLRVSKSRLENWFKR